jgi:LruC domain-containing protein
MTIDPSNGQVIDQWDVNGLHNKQGGDLKFDETNGILYLATFSGLYRCDFNGTSYDAVRISADNLPFTPTSMTIDSDGDLWLADNNSDGSLIIMDTVTGGWQYVYGANAANGTNFGRRINDLTTLRIFSDTVDTTDTDGDGIIDSQDDFPNDPDKAFEVFTPSEYGTGTIAFEDLWPSYGDYDFNDVALNYKAIAILNSDNLAVQVDIICRVKANGAGFTNGIGIEIEGLSSDQVQSVTGTVFSENYISLNPNGTEANQNNAVIILTDDAANLTNETTISIILDQPVSTDVLGAAPFNPFIIANKQRQKEIHLPYRTPTSLGQTTNSNNDPNGNYISDNGYPWAISIIHDFKVPKEKVRIYNAYNNFINWATSGGQQHTDWYKDNPGNRNDDLIELD